MEDLVKKEGLDWEVDSAGTGNWHVGESPDKRSTAIARKYRIDISEQSCRQFTAKDFERYDKIFVMDDMNLRDVLKLVRNEDDHEKVSLLLENAIVPDPYYEDDLFDDVFKMIEKGCKAIIEREK
jgi:protein-tyrosine phosphatase